MDDTAEHPEKRFETREDKLRKALALSMRLKGYHVAPAMIIGFSIEVTGEASTRDEIRNSPILVNCSLELTGFPNGLIPKDSDTFSANGHGEDATYSADVEFRFKDLKDPLLALLI